MRKNEIEFRIVGKDLTSGAFKAASGAIAGAAKMMATATVAIGTAASAAGAGLFAMAQKTANAQDQVQKLSDRLGISVDALSKFHHHAELSGVQTRTLDMALQRMGRRVAEAAQETGEAQGALKELGIDAKALAKLPLDQQMLTVADSIQGVSSQADKTRLAFKLFDSEGVALLQTMKNGSQGFKDSAADLERFGAVMSSQATANSAKFKDEWSRVQVALSGVSQGISNEVIPLFSGLFKKLSDGIADNRVAIVNFVTGAVTGFIKFGVIVSNVVSRVSEALSKVVDAESFAALLSSLANGFKDAFLNIVSFGRQIIPHLAVVMTSSFRAGWEAFKELGKGALDHVFDFITGNNIAKPFGDIVRDSIKAAMTEIDAIPAAFGNIKEIVIDSAKGTGEAILSIAGLTTDSLNAQTQALIDGMSLFGEVAAKVQDDAASGSESFTARVKDMFDQFSMSTIEIAESYMGNLKAVMDNMVSGIGNGIADIIVDGKNAVEVFKNIAKTVVKQLIASYVTMKLQRMLFAKTDAAASIGLTGANTMASMSLAPFPINLLAPAVAAEHTSIAAGFASTALAGVFHGGMDYVPAESTYLLNKGERVLSPRQNQDLTQFLDSGGSTVGDITVNVFTTATNFNSIADADVREFVAGKIIPALDNLDRQGIRPAAIERAIT